MGKTKGNKFISEINIMQHAGLLDFAPQLTDWSLNEWWTRVKNVVDTDVSKGLNSLIVLEASTICRHHNDSV